MPRSPHKFTGLIDKATGLQTHFYQPVDVSFPPTIEMMGGDTIELYLQSAAQHGAKITEQELSQLLSTIEDAATKQAVEQQVRAGGFVISDQDAVQLIADKVAAGELAAELAERLRETIGLPEDVVASGHAPAALAQPTVYQVNVDDPNGEWSKWFNELLEQQGIPQRFTDVGGKPQIETVAPEAIVQEWVNKFKASHPDYADLTYTVVSG